MINEAQTEREETQTERDDGASQRWSVFVAFCGSSDDR